MPILKGLKQRYHLGCILTGRYFVVESFDTLALVSSGRIQRESVPKGFYCYEVRHDDECMGIPCEISSHVLVNFWGTVISKV